MMACDVLPVAMFLPPTRLNLDRSKLFFLPVLPIFFNTVGHRFQKTYDILTERRSVVHGRSVNGQTH